jgi:hypothetical protein
LDVEAALTVDTSDQTEHAMSRGMLGTDVQRHVLGLDLD